MARRSPYPPLSLDEALILAKTIWVHNAGNPMRRVSIFHTLNRQPESSTSRQLITASAGYELTEGHYKSDILKLTERGEAIVENNDLRERINAVLAVDIFQAFFEYYRDKSIPSQVAALDFLKQRGIVEESAPGCFEVILENGRQVGLIQEISGKERIVSPEHALELLSKSANKLPVQPDAEKVQLNISEKTNGSLPQNTDLFVEHNTRFPGLHIDVQIHIAADTNPDQIDKIFESMARHLYNKG